MKNKKCMQTRRLGVPSQARWALTNGEYERLQGHYWCHEGRETSICASVVAAVQVYLIGRNDDVLRPLGLRGLPKLCPFHKNGLVEDRHG
eukprot:scaffold75760_cov60-Cyclotella_meneghiniana.AAC.17